MMKTEAASPKKNNSWLVRMFVIFLLVAVAAIAVYFVFLKFDLNLHFASPAENENSGVAGQSISFKFNNPAALKSWRDFSFSKKSEYKIEPNEYGEMALHATSQDAYSTIFKVINVPIESHPILSWQWRAVKFPKGKKHLTLGTAGDNDFPARICAVFTKNNPMASEIIQYVWDEYFPEDTAAKSPYKKNVRIIVARSGEPDPKNYWAEENRDLVKDYERVFGKKPENNLRAVSVITNSDDTHTESEAYIRNIDIKESIALPPSAKKKLFDLQKGIKDSQANIKKVFDFLTTPVRLIPSPWKKEKTSEKTAA